MEIMASVFAANFLVPAASLREVGLVLEQDADNLAAELEKRVPAKREFVV